MNDNHGTSIWTTLNLSPARRSWDVDDDTDNIVTMSS